MDLKDFYPTPQPLIAKMLENVDFNLAQPILEPSAGKGDIVTYIREHGHPSWHASRDIEVDTIEIEPDLQHILRGKGCTVVHDDFLTFASNKHYRLIVANFPFSNGDQHLQKALSLLEQYGGGSLICLVNAETLRNTYTNLRKAISAKLTKYEADIEYLSEQFVEAERKTDVEVALIRVTIPEIEDDSVLLDKLAKAEQLTAESDEQNQIVEADFIKALIKRFDMEARVGLSLIKEYRVLKPLMLQHMPKKDKDQPYNDSILELTVKASGGSYGGNLTNDYLKALRHKYWAVLIGDYRFTSRYTSNITSELARKLESLKDYDFTEFNIQQLQVELNSSLITGIEDAILKLFDDFTGRYSYHDDYGDNVHYYNGWKSNKASRINQKIIIPMNGFSSYSWDSKNKMDTYGYARDKLQDAVKVLNYLAGDLDTADRIVDDTIALANQVGKFRHLDFYYFEATFFKKGTCHITFKDRKLLDKFNIFGARKRGWLPPSYGRKHYREMDKEEQAVIDEFQGEQAYGDIMDDASYYIVESSQLLLES